MKSYVTVTSGSVNSGSSSGSNDSSGSSGSTSGTTVYIASVKLSSADSSLNVRSGPGSSYSAIGSFKHGETVYVIASNGDWYKLVYGDTTGYVLKSYIRLTGETGVLGSDGTVSENTGSGGSSSDSSSGSTSSAIVGKSGYIQLSSDSSSLNVRTGAGTDYAVAFTVKSGTKLTVLSDYGSWYGVEISGKTGYVSAQYVKLDSSDSSGSSSSSQSTATTTTAVNLRSIGSTSGEKLGTYSKGTTVTVLEKGDSWSKVQVGTKTGYMKNSYLSFS